MLVPARAEVADAEQDVRRDATDPCGAVEHGLRVAGSLKALAPVLRRGLRGGEGQSAEGQCSGCDTGSETPKKSVLARHCRAPFPSASLKAGNIQTTPVLEPSQARHDPLPDGGAAVHEAGQRYSLADATIETSYYYAKTYDDSLEDDHTVVNGKDKYYEIWFGHRLFYVRAADVVVTN